MYGRHNCSKSDYTITKVIQMLSNMIHPRWNLATSSLGTLQSSLESDWRVYRFSSGWKNFEFLFESHQINLVQSRSQWNPGWPTSELRTRSSLRKLPLSFSEKEPHSRVSELGYKSVGFNMYNIEESGLSILNGLSYSAFDLATTNKHVFVSSVKDDEGNEFVM